MIRSALDFIKNLTGLPDEGAEMILMVVAIYALATLASSIGEIFQLRVKV